MALPDGVWSPLGQVDTGQGHQCVVPGLPGCQRRRIPQGVLHTERAPHTKEQTGDAAALGQC